MDAENFEKNKGWSVVNFMDIWAGSGGEFFHVFVKCGEKVREE